MHIFFDEYEKTMLCYASYVKNLNIKNTIKTLLYILFPSGYLCILIL